MEGNQDFQSKSPESSRPIKDVVNLLDEAKKAERKSVMDQTEVEREWYKSDARFYVREAAPEGALVKVDDNDKPYKLIGRLLGPDQIGTPPEPDVLSPIALDKLNEVSELWVKAMQGTGLDTDNIRLAVTSLYRDEKLQTTLSNPDASGAYYAAPPRESSHLAGAAFDLDPTSYYVKEGDKFLGVNRSGQPFNPQVISLLQTVLNTQMEQKKVNFVIENKIVAQTGEIRRVPAVYHVCTNPQQ